MITLDVPNRSLHLDVSAQELAERKNKWQAAEIPLTEKRGYAHLYRTHVTQADTGADFDFLIGKSGAKLPKSSH
jgi:dihydroxy-acid dehydratase